MRQVRATAGLREPPPALPALDDRGIVAVGREYPGGIAAMRVADHVEQRLLAAAPVDDPLSVENLVPAVLGVRLREHHQLDVGRVAAESRKGLGQVVDLVGGEREPEFGIGLLERRAAPVAERHARQRLRRRVLEQQPCVCGVAQHALRHAVVQDPGQRLPVRIRRAVRELEVIGDAALDTSHDIEAAYVSDVRGLARPGRNGAEPGHDDQRLAARLFRRARRAVAQQRCEYAGLFGSRLDLGVHDVQEPGVQPPDSADPLAQGGQQLFQPEVGERGSTAEYQHGAPPPAWQGREIIPEAAGANQRPAASLAARARIAGRVDREREMRDVG